ncbi:transcriptional regulator family: Fungal Specific TF [Penicillium roqueforti]|nr:transcriptional regulator family: Fungal Specific TF [Penicillium roqueforti]
MASSVAPRQILRRRRTPGSRAARACVHCKEKKLKCDDKAPSCANCHRFRLTCLVEDPEDKKLRPRKYLETLEERLASLEKQKNPHTSDASTASTPALPTSADSSRSLPVFFSESEESSVSNLPARVGYLDFKATQIEPQYLGSSSSFAFAHLINPSLREALIHKPPTPLRAAEKAESAPLPCLLPEYQIATTLSNAYFENIHPQYPFLHEPTFRHHEEQVFSSFTYSGDLGTLSIPLFFLNMVYAVGACIVPGYQHLAEQLYSSAQLYPEVLLLDNLEAIQAILCYAMYSLRSSKGPSLWKLSGLALRQCIELGYHRSSKRGHLKKDPLHVELSKRVFWVSQGIDVSYALRLGRPLGIQLNEIDAELPLDIDDFMISASGIHGVPRTWADGIPANMSNSIHVIRLRQIWARIHTSVYSAAALEDANEQNRRASVIHLRADLEHWRATAPEPLPRRGKTLSIFSTKAWYELNYSGSILNLYRSQLAQDKNTPSEIFVDCMNAASFVCREYRRQYIGTSVKHTWSTLHCLFLAGLTYLHCLWTSPVACQSVQHQEFSKTCTDCTMVLVVIAEAWEGAAPYRDIFEVLASHTMSMMISRSLLPQPLPQTHILADTSEREAVSRWISDMDDMDMLNVFDDLLTGFIDDSGPYSGITGMEL